MILTIKNKTYKIKRLRYCFGLYYEYIDSKTNKPEYVNIIYATSLSYIFKYLFNSHVLDESEFKSLTQCIVDTSNTLNNLLDGCESQL